MQGLEFKLPVKDIILKCGEGIDSDYRGTNIIRFVPPLIIEKMNVDEMIAILDECLAEI
jgi:acetylornithine/N-succinyldiaminopimelate aminotransferase